MVGSTTTTPSSAGGVVSGAYVTVVLLDGVTLPRTSRRPLAVTVEVPAGSGAASVSTTVVLPAAYVAAVTAAPGMEKAAAETLAGSSGSSTVTVTVRPSALAVAETSCGPTVSTAKTEFWRLGVPPAGSVLVAKLARSLGPSGSMRSSVAFVPPHAGV